ncbi:MAG: hypothetical protein P8188_15845 [Gemmatimonadota bacterium]
MSADARSRIARATSDVLALLAARAGLVATVVATAGAPGLLQAQGPLVAEESALRLGNESWSVAITPYAWLAGQSSDVDGQALRQSFSDLASITNLGFQGRIAARVGKVIFGGDYTYADQTSTTAIGRTSIDMGVVQHIVDLKVGYPVYDSRARDTDGGGLALWLAAGARYWDNDTEFTITRQPILPGGETEIVEEQAAQTWWDPVLGALAHWPVTDRVGFTARGTVGGFGIGDASSYLWDGEGAATFRLGRRFLLSAGYRAFRYDRTDGEGDDEVHQNVTVMGLILGLSVGVF